MPGPDRESGRLQTLLVTVGVCLACSIFVSTATVLLRPRQEAHRERERQARILEIVARQPGLDDLLAELGDASVEARVIEFETGSYADWIDPASFDQRRAAADPLQSIALPAERDLARIGRRARYATVYVVQGRERVELVLLPIHGRGYASMIYGYVALGPDGDTVRGLSFYENGETPGLGSEIEDPEWLAQWVGKRVRDDEGNLRIGVAVDEVEPSSPDFPFTVDGLTGATLTCQGVTRLLRFWLGDDGFAAFIARTRT